MGGSLVLVFMYLTQTDKKTKLAKDPAITALVISASWICGMFIAGRGGAGSMTTDVTVGNTRTVTHTATGTMSPINPAIVIGSLSSATLHGGYFYCWSWILFTFPFAGSIVGVLAFEFLHKSVSNEPNQKSADQIIAENPDEAPVENKEEEYHGEYEIVGI